MASYELLGRLPGFVERLRTAAPNRLEKSIFELRGWCGSTRQLWKEATEAAVCLANSEGGIVLIGLYPDRSIDEAPPCPHEGVTPEWLQDSIRKTTPASA